MPSQEREHVQEGPAVSPVTRKLCISKDSLSRAVLKDGKDFGGGPAKASGGRYSGVFPGSMRRAGRTDLLPNLRATSSSACSAARQLSSRRSMLS